MANPANPANPAYPDLPRVDARDKVTGAPIYASDLAFQGTLHGVLAVSTINRGRVRSLDASRAKAVKGVRLVMTHQDMQGVQPPGFLLGGGFGFQNFQPMLSDQIAYRGQPVALVVADTLEAAQQGAAAIQATYEAEPFRVTIDAPPPQDVVAQQGSPLPQQMFADKKAGDADAAYTAAPVKVDAEYRAPPQHQNPMELLSTVAHWRDGMLVIHEGSQNVGAIRNGLAKQLGIEAGKIQVISPQVGGGFGQKNSLQMHTVLAAVAARKLGRPVKLVVPRGQTFHDASFRPATRHHIRLGAQQGGKIVAAIHESEQQTSRHDLFPSSFADATARLHGIANFRGREHLVRTDVQTPGYMRAPFEHSGCYAFECAVDELAQKLDMDPVALRLANDTDKDPLTGKPFSSRHLAQCLRQGAERFGWAQRSARPRSMTAGDGTEIGWGVACGAYKAATAAAMGRIRATAAGDIHFSVAGHEMGQGLRTALVNVLSRPLDVAPGRIRLQIGDTRGAPQHLTAGSWGTATAIPAAEEAARQLLAALRRLPGVTDAGQTPAGMLRQARRDQLEVEVRTKAPGQPDQIFEKLQGGQVATAGPVYPEFVAMSYVAHFVEARVEPRTRRIRIPRVVSVVDCGRVVSPRTAASQVRGAVIWGIGAALREVSEVDPRYGGFLNADLAEYVIPVNADIATIDVGFIDIPDPRLNSAGVKGLGEVGMTGLAAAIANAVHHATGRRIRHLPMRIEDVL